MGYVSSSVGTKRKSAGMTVSTPKRQKMVQPQRRDRGSVHPLLGRRVSVSHKNGRIYAGTIVDITPASLGTEAQLRLNFDEEVPGGRWYPESCVV